MTHIKICGIKNKIHAPAACEAGADFIGLVFAPSPRQVTPTQASEIVDALKKNSNTTVVVGLFVNTPPAEVNAIADACHLDWVQLHGDEPWEYCLEIDKPVIKAVRLGQGQQAEQVCEHLALAEKTLSDKKHIFLLDAMISGKYGGTGRSVNRHLARKIAQEFPFILAGGLTPENVAEAIQMVAPWGVDVSSGVEVNGVKDNAKIRAFIETVRRVDDSRR